MKSIYLSKIREQNPLIHNITNIVAANFSANGLLALGASPLMSANIEEMVDVPKNQPSIGNQYRHAYR